MKNKFLVGLLVAAVGAGGYAYYARQSTAAPQVRTGAVSRGAIVQVVQAVGTVEPMNTVTVGSQVSGVISWLGADFNTVVKKGSVLARLDPSLLQASRDQERANLSKVKADVQQRTMDLADARMKETRASTLAAGGLLSASDLESATLAVHAAETALESSRAQVVQAEASLNQAQVNLDHSTITAPIDGIVLQRSVDVGQTVAASLSSPTIFLIAADLTEMRVNASVDEGDISHIREGQPVRVKVDAYPNESFAGVVSQVRLQPVVVSNVTSYPAIIDVDNTELKLKPGMTASVSIELASRADVFRVPNAALRFHPDQQTLAALGQPTADGERLGATTTGGSSLISSSSSTSPSTQDAVSGRGAATMSPAVFLTSAATSSGRPTERAASAAASTTTKCTVWVYQDGQLRAIGVTLGLADSTNTEIISPALAEGTAVVTTVVASAEKTAAVRTTSSSIFTGPQGGAAQGRGR
ncbi:MAG: efflux RND transporter periplasmic adaptor subunit [Acidobacteriota bacterium]